MQQLVIDHVYKAFGEVQAVQDLSLAIEEGSVFGLLGPNGAGKTTTIRMVMEIIIPDQGKIEIFGKRNTAKSRDLIGYLPEERGLNKKMRILDTVLFFGELKGVSSHSSRHDAETWLKRLELWDWREKKVEELSRGMQQKLQFICTIIHKPKLIILDEPFTGLDPVNAQLLKDVMLDLRERGTTIIFSTHLMEQVEKLCESIVLINRGKIVLSGPLKEVKRKFGQNSIRLRYEGKASFLSDSELVEKFDDYGNYVEIQPAKNVTSQQILKKAIEQVTIKGFEKTEPSLNDIFIQAVKN